MASCVCVESDCVCAEKPGVCWRVVFRSIDGARLPEALGRGLGPTCENLPFRGNRGGWIASWISLALSNNTPSVPFSLPRGKNFVRTSLGISWSFQSHTPFFLRPPRPLLVFLFLAFWYAFFHLPTPSALALFFLFVVTHSCTASSRASLLPLEKVYGLPFFFLCSLSLPLYSKALFSPREQKGCGRDLT